MRFVFPSNVLKPRMPDEMYADQVDAFKAQGFDTSLFSLESLDSDPVRFIPSINPDDVVLYRGWMMAPKEYSRFVAVLSGLNANPFTNLDGYLSCHYLPNWYPILKDLTPETKIFPADADLASELKSLGWDKFFLKDYVKSLKTSVGSFIDDPSKVTAVIAEMQKFRGQIEGGLCVRRVEEFLPETETRYFIINGTPFSSERETTVPDIVKEISSRIKSRFFSADIVKRADGTLRLVEIGDGQVSDIVGWTANRLAEVCKEAIG